MTILLAAWKYRRLIALVGGIFVLAALGLIIWGQHATIAGQAETITANETVIKEKQGEIDGAVRINKGLVTAFDQYKALRDANDAEAAAGAAVAQDRDEAVTEIHKEIARAPHPASAAPAAMPYSNDALRRLRDLKAARAAGHHADPGGAGGRPAADAGPVPARP